MHNFAFESGRSIATLSDSLLHQMSLEQKNRSALKDDCLTIKSCFMLVLRLIVYGGDMSRHNYHFALKFIYIKWQNNKNISAFLHLLNIFAYQRI